MYIYIYTQIFLLHTVHKNKIKHCNQKKGITYVYMYTCTYMYMCICVYIYTCAQVCIYIIYIYVCMCICIYKSGMCLFVDRLHTHTCHVDSLELRGYHATDTQSRVLPCVILLQAPKTLACQVCVLFSEEFLALNVPITTCKGPKKGN